MTKRRLVVVSNRLPVLVRDAAGLTAVPAAGGLVGALLPVMNSIRQGLWIGWSGHNSAGINESQIHQVEHPIMRLVGMDLTEQEYEDYYNGFCNRTLWPMFHDFQARVRVDRGEQDCYFEVNEKFSKALVELLEPEDVVWVHDYHMVPLGMFLRQQGFRGPLGFFLHIPFPPLEMIEILPNPVSFVKAWHSYDLVGFHTDRYRDNYFEVSERLTGAVRGKDLLRFHDHQQRVITDPIGIDPGVFDPKLKAKKPAGMAKGFKPEFPGCKLALGVDRLDYTKGIPERMLAFERFLRRYPHWRKKLSLIQVCSPSRTRVKEYREQKDQVDYLVGKINGEYAEHDWMPIRYLYRTYQQADLAYFYRDTDIALVTPLRDGMNVVAMEYVASQPPSNPGVLILSKFTGVAEYLKTALLVNPYLLDSVAEGIEQALTMSLAERKDRYQAMMAFINENTSWKWAGRFIEILDTFHGH